MKLTCVSGNEQEFDRFQKGLRRTEQIVVDESYFVDIRHNPMRVVEAAR